MLPPAPRSSWWVKAAESSVAAVLALALILPPLRPTAGTACPPGEAGLGELCGASQGLPPDPGAQPRGAEFGNAPQDSLTPSTPHLSSSFCPKAPNTLCTLKPKTSNESFSREIAAVPEDAGSASPSRTSAAWL